MLPDDTFRTRRQDVATALEAWAAEMAPWARVEHGSDGDSWWIGATPIAPTACPFEIVVRADQKLDAMIGGALYENLDGDQLADLPRIVRAIADGRVLIRRWASSTTDLPYGVETIVDLPDGGEWRAGTPEADTAPGGLDSLLAQTQAFAPYRR